MWQPIDGGDDFRRELHADGDVFLAIGIVGTLEGVSVQQLAMKAGEKELSGILVVEFDEADFGAAIAQRLPLLGGHLVQLLGFPEGLGGHCRGVADAGD